MPIKKCEICGKEYENLGAHMYHAHSKTSKVEIENRQPEIRVDEFMEKPLSALISNLKEILRPYRNHIDVRISETGGKPYEIEIRARIQL